MTETTLDIKHWGNSLGVRLPAAVARAAKVRVDQRVRTTVEYGKVIIDPVAPAELTLAEQHAWTTASLAQKSGRGSHCDGNLRKYRRRPN